MFFPINNRSGEDKERFPFLWKKPVVPDEKSDRTVLSTGNFGKQSAYFVKEHPTSVPKHSDIPIIPTKKKFKKKEESGIPLKVSFFSGNFQWKGPFHLIFFRNDRFFLTNGKCPRGG